MALPILHLKIIKAGDVVWYKGSKYYVQSNMLANYRVFVRIPEFEKPIPIEEVELDGPLKVVDFNVPRTS